MSLARSTRALHASSVWLDPEFLFSRLGFLLIPKEQAARKPLDQSPGKVAWKSPIGMSQFLEKPVPRPDRLTRTPEY